MNGDKAGFHSRRRGRNGDRPSILSVCIANGDKAGFHEYAFSMGLGGGFGGLMPMAGFGELIGTGVGGTVEYAYNGRFFGTGMQVGGLVGGFAGSGLYAIAPASPLSNVVRKTPFAWQSLRPMGWQVAGMGIGGGLGYAYGGDAQSVLVGMNIGQMGGAFARSSFLYSKSLFSRSVLNYHPSSGAALVSSPRRTTTVIGVFRKNMKSIIDELGNLGSYYFGRQPGRFNVLNVPEYDPKTFWNKFNKPWLSAAVRRGDRILCATVPVFEVGSLMKYNEQGKFILSGFGHEYLFLRQQGYIYDPISRCMIKI